MVTVAGVGPELCGNGLVRNRHAEAELGSPQFGLEPEHALDPVGRDVFTTDCLAERAAPLWDHESAGHSAVSQGLPRGPCRTPLVVSAFSSAAGDLGLMSSSECTNRNCMREARDISIVQRLKQ